MNLGFLFMVFHRVLAWGSGCLVSVLMILGIAAGTLLTPTVLAQTYQETLNQKMANLKKTEDRWIEINLTTQRLTSWEGAEPVKTIAISTGKKNTPTIPGLFTIQSKRRIDRMKGPGYDIDDVPYAQYYSSGYAIHGAYWHKKFGTPVSHGCTNLAIDHAKWLFNWSKIGTPVIIHP